MRAAAPLVLVLAWSLPAAAQSCRPVEVHGCGAALDVRALIRALGTEGIDCDVEARCEGGFLALPSRDARWELDAIPAPVRARVIAILIAERLREDESPAPAPAPESESESESAPAPASASASESAPASASASASASAPALLLASAEPVPIAPATALTPAPASTSLATVQTTVPASEIANEPTLAEALAAPGFPRRTHPGALYVWHDAPLSPGVGPRFGVGGDLFVFLDPSTALGGPTVLFGYDALRIEAGWAFGGVGDPELGNVESMLGHLSVGVGLACARFHDASLCASALATVGYARADPRPRGDTIARTAEGPYAGGALELAAWLSTELVAASLGVRGGWGYGLVLAADETDLAAIGGPWIGAHLAIELEPVR